MNVNVTFDRLSKRVNAANILLVLLLSTKYVIIYTKSLNIQQTSVALEFGHFNSLGTDDYYLFMYTNISNAITSVLYA